jgi:3-phenylpropionate/trans-cinnamate dioxygenase ferredoxin reductase subunit
LVKLEFSGDSEGKVSKLILRDGAEIEADLVIMATGGELNTKLAAQASLNMDNEGAIKTNPFMQTSDPDIFAAGDIASVPNWHVGKSVRVEHWAAA